MDELSCQQFQNLAAELALNIVGVRERGLALRHLHGCARCSETVQELTELADGLVELLPEAEPPAGFENRVVAALTPATARRPRVLVRTAALLGAAALVGAVLVGDGLPGDGSEPGAIGLSQFASSGERTVQYAPLVRESQEVGQAYLYRGDPPWIYLSLAAPNPGTDAGTVHCEVVHDDGTTTYVGSVPLNQGKVSWGGPAPAPPDTLVGARVVDHAGHTLAVARFRPRVPRQSLRTATPATPTRHPTDGADHDGRQGEHDTDRTAPGPEGASPAPRVVHRSG
jgi:hypothetical protein